MKTALFKESTGDAPATGNDVPSAGSDAPTTGSKVVAAGSEALATGSDAVAGCPALAAGIATPQAERATIARIWALWLPKALERQCLDGSANQGAFAQDASGWYCGRHGAYTLARLLAARLWVEPIGASAQAAGLPPVSAERLDSACDLLLDFLLRRQAPDGRLDFGGMYSPNEAGFPMPALVIALRRLYAENIAPTPDFGKKLEQFLHRSAEAVLNGSPMTANHRWAAVAAPLAAAHALWPDARYLKRIESLLAEGIDIDADGCWYEERSPNYNSVASRGLLSLADLLGRPDLLAPLRRHGEFLLHGIQPNGEADSTISHRQDRAMPGRAVTSYGVARALALLCNDGRYTTLAAHCLQQGAAEPEADDELVPLPLQLDARRLPPALPLPERYEVHHTHIRQARMREGESLVSLAADAGSHFYDSVRDRWGGARRSDDWLHIHHGDIVIESMYLASAWMQNLQPRSLSRLGEGHYQLEASQAGWVHPLHFSPGRPEVFVNWGWHTTIEARYHPGGLNLTLASTTPQSLICSLILWVRPGVHFLQEGEAARELRAGEMVHLGQRGCASLCDSRGQSITLSGLPAAAHNLPQRFASAIPSGIQRDCAALHLGLRFPVDLDLQFIFNGSAND